MTRKRAAAGESLLSAAQVLSNILVAISSIVNLNLHHRYANSTNKVEFTGCEEHNSASGSSCIMSSVDLRGEEKQTWGFRYGYPGTAQRAKK